MGEKRGRSRTTFRALRVRGPVQFDAGFKFKGLDVLPSAALFGFLSQQGTDAPGLEIGKSTIPGTITLARQGVGTYTLTFEGAPLGWHAMALTESPNPVAQIYASIIAPSGVLITTYENGALTDEILSNTPLLIFVFA